MFDEKMIHRFHLKFHRLSAEECWPWHGSRSPDGYGEIRFTRSRKKAVATHVAIFVDRREIVPSGMLVCHTCDNPPCVNPNHLYVGSRADNMRDMHDRGLWHSGQVKGEDNGNSVLKDSDIFQIVSMINGGLTNSAIASRFGVTHSTISLIRLGKKWSHITGWTDAGNRRRRK